MRKLLLALVLSLTGCATQPASSGADEWAQQVILVSLPEPLQEDFIADTMKLGTIPGVVEIHIGHPIRFKDPSLDWWIDDYDIAIFIRFKSEEVTDAYGAHALHEAWNEKWSDKFTSFRAMRVTSAAAAIEYD
jgi:hypothetical protein